HAVEDAPMLKLPLYAGTSDADGLVIVAHAAGAKKLTLLAQHPRYGVASAEVGLGAGEKPEEKRIVLVAPGEVRGTVTESGHAPQLGKWTLVVAARDGSDGAVPRLMTPDAEGRFVVRGLAPGGYEVSAIPSLRAVRSLGSVVTMAMTASLDLLDGGASAETE